MAWLANVLALPGEQKHLKLHALCFTQMNCVLPESPIKSGCEQIMMGF
jgi:hypothetical protein